MNTTELSELLHAATDGLEPPADFARHVLAGGRRRRLRRRLTAVASAVAAVAVAAAGTAVLNHEPEVSAAEKLLNTPTKGALAGNRAFLNDVVRAWEDGLPIAQEARFRYYDDLRGDPHIVWAGDTPVGRAAVVVQQTYVHRDYWVHDDGMRIAKGLVAIDPADGRLKLVATLSPNAGTDAVSYFMFGPMDRTLLIVDEGQPLYYSTNSQDAEAGEIQLGGPFKPEWKRVRATDGAAVVQIAIHPGAGQVQHIVAYQGDHPPTVVDFTTESIRNYQSTGPHLEHVLPDPHYRLPLPNFFPWKDRWTLGTPVSGVDADELVFNARPRGTWQITAWVPDRVVVLQETMVIKESSERDSKGSVLSVMTRGTGQNDANAEVFDVGLVDHDAVLPIKYRLPDGAGWVVARKGEPLSYRTQGGQWQDAGTDAALLPDNAVEVKVGDRTVKL